MKRFHSKNETFNCKVSSSGNSARVICTAEEKSDRSVKQTFNLPYTDQTVEIDDATPILNVPFQDCTVPTDITPPAVIGFHKNGKLLPQMQTLPPTNTLMPLDGENCIAKDATKNVEDSRDLNQYILGLTYNQLCNWITAPLTGYNGVTNPSALNYVLDPPLAVPPGQKGFNMVPPYPPTPFVDLTGRNVLVVGASKNIGLATASLFVTKGCNVVGTSRHPDGYTETTFTYPLLKLDIRQSKDVRSFFRKLMKDNFTNGKIDVLVLTPGIQWTGDMQDADGDDLSDLLSFQIGGFQRVVFNALPFMKHSNSARVISFGSEAGEFPNSLNGYAIGKRALQQWNDCHMLDALRRKAMGESTYEPTFTLVEPGIIQSTIGLYEKYIARNTNYFDVSIRGQTMAFKANQSATTVVTPILVGVPPCPAVPSTCGDLPFVVADAVHQIVIAPQPSIRYLVDPSHPVVNFVNAVAAANILSADDTLKLVTVPVMQFFWDPASAALGQTVLDNAYC